MGCDCLCFTVRVFVMSSMCVRVCRCVLWHMLQELVQLWMVCVCVCVTCTMCIPSVHVFILPSDLYPPAPAGLDRDGGVRQLVRPWEALDVCVCVCGHMLTHACVSLCIWMNEWLLQLIRSGSLWSWINTLALSLLWPCRLYGSPWRTFSKSQREWKLIGVFLETTKASFVKNWHLVMLKIFRCSSLFHGLNFNLSPGLAFKLCEAEKEALGYFSSVHLCCRSFV